MIHSRCPKRKRRKRRMKIILFNKDLTCKHNRIKTVSATRKVYCADCAAKLDPFTIIENLSKMNATAENPMMCKKPRVKVK